MFHYVSDTANKITEDYELQNWGRDLALSRDEGGVGINVGLPNPVPQTEQC